MLALAAVWFIQWQPATFSTPAAQRQTVVLADGTRAELNALTTLRVRLRGNERHVWLEKGEVLFTVAKDPARPFVVETTAGSVRVTGTVFNVSSHAADSLAVVLLEGSVEATPVTDKTLRRLTPGDELVAGADRCVVRRLSAAEMADAVAWREGKIVFHDTPLAQALARFARHHARVIEIAPAAQDLALGGRFDLDDLDGFLRDLGVALPVTVRHEPDGRILVDRILEKGK
jgi:transmembrane sensor